MRTGPQPITLHNIRAVLTEYCNNIFSRRNFLFRLAYTTGCNGNHCAGFLALTTLYSVDVCGNASPQRDI